VEGFAAGRVIADTAYGGDPFRGELDERGIGTVIPSNESRPRPIPHDRHLCKERHVVECFFAKHKQSRLIATLYEKTARNFLAMIHLACATVWLR